MKQNVGTADRIFRIVLGCALIGFALFAPAVPYHYLGWIGIISIITAFVGFCPLYTVLGIATSRS